MRFALLVTLLSGCRAACMLPSATEPTTADCQTLCDAGSCGCSAPWSVMRQESVSTGAVRWSSGYRWNTVGIFDFYDWQNSVYKCCNGHYNNYHWSIYCDNGNGGYVLGPGCTTTAMPAGYQTPFGGAQQSFSSYYRFHHNNDKTANGNYLFYFR